MKKLILTLIALPIIGVVVAVTLVVLNPATDMEYLITTSDPDSIRLFANLNERITGYSTRRTQDGIEFILHMDDKKSGPVEIGVSHQSRTLFYQDDWAHAGGGAKLSIKGDQIDIEYFQLNYL